AVLHLAGTLRGLDAPAGIPREIISPVKLGYFPFPKTAKPCRLCRKVQACRLCGRLVWKRNRIGFRRWCTSGETGQGGQSRQWKEANMANGCKLGAIVMGVLLLAAPAQAQFLFFGKKQHEDPPPAFSNGPAAPDPQFAPDPKSIPKGTPD